MQNQYLYHYGVKGMRWGVRKERRAQRKQYQTEESDVMRKFRQVTNSAMDQDYNRRRHANNSYYAQTNKNKQKQAELDAKVQKSLDEYHKSTEVYDKSKAELIDIGRKFCDRYSNERVSELFGSKSETVRNRANIEQFINMLERDLIQ